MGETTVWGYIALAAAALGFAFGLWRQKRSQKKKASANSPETVKKKELLDKIDESEKNE